MSNANSSWARLPPELRNEVLSILSGPHGAKYSQLATISREWHSFFEPLIFAEISLTPSCLFDPNSTAIFFRKRSLIRYIWFRVELERYHCHKCPLEVEEDGNEEGEDEDVDVFGENPADDNLIVYAFQSLVTVVLLRQQTRRQWWPATLTNMLTRFPNMKELCYEPWREWSQSQQLNDQLTQQFIDSLHKTKLSKLTIFENFNEAYPESSPSCPSIRVPSPVVSHKLARASVQLTELSASYNVNASCFFWASKKLLLEWRNLTRLALTARALTGDADFEGINSILRNAAGAALRMPKLETMELWNGRQGVAMLFRYQKARDGQSAFITVRGTLELPLGSTVTEALEAVALRHHHGKVVVQSSLIDPTLIRCHGDAIRQLGLSVEVIRPVSLQQIIEEHQIREGLTTS
ncbi:hypothetical protein GCG54_00008083 [Colletotrichum gloeosporioides]|uniref:DUF6546 domain-containing protein n=1 Tax=Colletotrichum gloeosporioides TaxID=474922 RepID=A0A8H4FLD9_COLGL|nr:uncharacterized protein GCG54_00008083 [Colletotrichum gloeosporioides]KAF3806568.1 hypothetical protein GCG54_00008083 [Colletotrichum gloeosporioides]